VLGIWASADMAARRIAAARIGVRGRMEHHDTRGKGGLGSGGIKDRAPVSRGNLQKKAAQLGLQVVALPQTPK
jgi:hypothetical protein